MVKLDYDRDYYADLELPGTADAVDVKKQFKKLGEFCPRLPRVSLLTPKPALKWHPDRNPGKEDEAKEKFLVIQAAHEILTDPATKAKFDNYRQRTSRYPGASGVRGNPWQFAAHEANAKYGAPPTRRPQMPTRPPAPTAAASTKKWDWAKNGKPPAANTGAHPDPWAHSRPQSKPSQTSGAAAGPSARPPKVPPREPPTPRTASQARRQEAAFGNRKTGYAPASPMGDEPPVRNPHYNTNPNITQTSKPRPTSEYVDPLSTQFSETFLDNRQSTPYAANVGEKTNPFEPLNVNRAKSMRDGARRFQDGAGGVPPPPPPRQRSASTGSENFKRSTNENPASKEQTAPQPGFQHQSRASARYSPRGPPETSSAPSTATFPGANSSSSSVNSSANGKSHRHSFEVGFANGSSSDGKRRCF
jgi:curved DNA-binding protein CbpA